MYVCIYIYKYNTMPKNGRDPPFFGMLQHAKVLVNSLFYYI